MPGGTRPPAGWPRARSTPFRPSAPSPPELGLQALRGAVFQYKICSTTIHVYLVCTDIDTNIDIDVDITIDINLDRCRCR